MTAKGYWIAAVTPRAAGRYADYQAAAEPAYRRFGARFVVRGGDAEVMEGAFRPRLVVVEFPSLAAARACYESAEYAAARAIRAEIADTDLAIVEGPPV